MARRHRGTERERISAACAPLDDGFPLEPGVATTLGDLSGGLPSNDYFAETDWRAYNAKAQLGVVFDQTP